MIRLIKPYISYQEIEPLFKEIFASGILTKGKNVESFREMIASYTQAKHAFLTTSATTALSLALKMYDIGIGDEVIISDFSFPATVNVVEDIGATPVFADVDLSTFNMLPSELSKKISPRTKAVIFVDALGNPSGIHEIKNICEQFGLPLIEDAACAMGSSENGMMCGNIADITCFSFHPRKLLTTGEGGAITCNDNLVAEKIAIKLNHGGSLDTSGKLEFIDYGYNYRMSELQAAMGTIQLTKLNRIINERNVIRDKYIDGLVDSGFKSQIVCDGVIYNVQSVVFKTPDNVDRTSLSNQLASMGVETTLGTYCLSSTRYFRQKYNHVNKNAAYLENNTITLPCFEGLKVDAVIESIHKALNL